MVLVMLILSKCNYSYACNCISGLNKGVSKQIKKHAAKWQHAKVNE